MAQFTENALEQLKKSDLINIVLSLQTKLDTASSEALEEIRKLNDHFVKMESDLAITKRTNSLLEERVISLEKQCWANAQYSRRECVEISGIPAIVNHEDLEDKVVQIFGNVGCQISREGIEACHRVRRGSDNVIVKFSKRKVCQSVLSVKRDLKKLENDVVGLPGNAKIFVNQSLCSYYKMLWAKSKKLHTLGKINSFYVSNSTIKIRIQEGSEPISITHTADFEEHFPGVDLSPSDR